MRSCYISGASIQTTLDMPSGRGYLAVVFFFIYRKIGHLDVGLSWNFLICGCVVFRISEWLRKRFSSASLARTVTVSLCELILTVSVLIICYFSFRQINFFAVLLFAGLVCLLTWGCSIQSKLLSNRVSDYLGKISYAMYVNQMLILKITMKYFSAYHFRQIIFWYIVVIIVWAALQCYIVEKIQTQIKKRKKVFIKA